MKNVFISFSSKDTAEATRVCDLLENSGFSCFICTRDLIAGHEYAEQLLQNIDHAQAFVLLLSASSNDSPHVLREVEYAVSHKVPILVYKLEEVELSRSMQYYLMTHQWITNSENRDRKLLEGVRHILGETTPAADTRSQKPVAPVIPIKRLVAMGAIVLLLLVIVCPIVIRTFISHRPQTSDSSPREDTFPSYSAGDSVNFGTYHDNPIEWRVLRVNEDGTMVLLSKYILSIKSFDAAEGGKYNEYDGVDYWSYDNYNVTDEELLIKIRGNNDWSVSNLRTWLNSDREAVHYPDQPPTPGAVGDNFYHTEPGFLHGFTDEEKSALVKVTNRSVANSFSENVSDGYVLSEDLVYLLSSEELSWLEDAGMLPYAQPSESCVEHDEYRESYLAFTETSHTRNYYWWLRDNPGEKINEVYIVVTEYEEGHTVVPISAGTSTYGVRPAVTVDMRSDAIRKETLQQ